MCWHCYSGFLATADFRNAQFIHKMDVCLVSIPTIITRKFQPAQPLNLFSKPAMQNTPHF